MRLPNAENAVVDIAKLRDYCLNPTHPKGKHKARIFLEKLGLTQGDAERLRQSILEVVLLPEAMAIEQEPTPFGRGFILDLEISRGDGIVLYTAVVRMDNQAWRRFSAFDYMLLSSEEFLRWTKSNCSTWWPSRRI